jgi:hypothetical protein
VVRVDDVDELGETLQLFSKALGVADRDVTRTCVYRSQGAPRHSRGPGGSAGLELAIFEPTTLAALRARAGIRFVGQSGGPYHQGIQPTWI